MARPAATPASDTAWVPAFKCVVPDEPVPKGRPRIGRNGRAYTPKKTRKWEEAAALMMAAAHQGEPLSGPLRVVVSVTLDRPKNLQRKKDCDGRAWAPVRPDADNFAKAALDALQAAGVIADDGLVVELLVRKFYAARGDKGRLYVTVEIAE